MLKNPLVDPDKQKLIIKKAKFGRKHFPAKTSVVVVPALDHRRDVHPHCQHPARVRLHVDGQAELDLRVGDAVQLGGADRGQDRLRVGVGEADGKPRERNFAEHLPDNFLVVRVCCW